MPIAADEKRRASACFAHIAFPDPPPPPVHIAHDTAAASSLWRQRERLGDLEKYEAPRKTDRAQWAEDTTNALLQTDALIDALGENNPILREMLATAKQEIYVAGTDNAVVDEEAAAAYAAATSGAEFTPVDGTDGTDTTTTTTTTTGSSGYGRRLMQRREYNVRMTDELITAEIMEFYGKGGIPGVSLASCEVQFAIKPYQTQTPFSRLTLVNSGALRGHGAAGQRAPRRHLPRLCLQARGALLVR